jgi:hypothetical protein
MSAVDLINVYCDESCHLEHDGQNALVLGAICCPAGKKREVAQRLAEIRARHNMNRTFEFKWTKVGPSKIQMYMDIIDYFFDDDDLKFRCLVVPNKSIIDHKKFKQSHDDWYYKMYFNMLKVIFKPTDHYHIYIDIKDTKSRDKVAKLHDVLCNSQYDFSQSMIRRVQQVRSHEVLVAQLADILIGAVSYKFRKDYRSTAKMKLVSRIVERSGYNLEKSTLYREEKFNLLIWQSAEA